MDGKWGGRGEELDGGLDEGGVVFGVFVEVEGGFLKGLRSSGVPHEKPCGCGRHATQEPDELFHTRFPFAFIMNGAEGKLGRIVG